MNHAFLTLYVLAGPVVVAGVLFVLVRAYVREARKASGEGRPLI